MGLLLLAPLIVFGEDAYNFKQNSQADLKISCFDDAGVICSSATTCHITVIKPDSTVLVNNGTMTRSSTYYNYSLDASQTSTLGKYQAVVYCSGETNAYNQFDYLITLDGIDSKSNNNLLLFLIIGGILFLVLGFVFETKLFGILSGALFVTAGIYMMIYGAYNLSNLYTRTLAFISIGLGFILWTATAMDYIEDTKEGL